LRGDLDTKSNQTKWTERVGQPEIFDFFANPLGENSSARNIRVAQNQGELLSTVTTCHIGCTTGRRRNRRSNNAQAFNPCLMTVLVVVCLVVVNINHENRKKPFAHLAEISWAVLPLVAGLFVLVEGLQRTGVINSLAQVLHAAYQHSATHAGWWSGAAVALTSNLINNLPAGLIAGSALATAHAPTQVASAALIGVDLGPNLSVTGSLATILWLNALRRDGIEVSALSFLKLGIVVATPALIAALASVAMMSGA
jgi:Na+/H+ antiporter NhaD/arsenite permease-like protein